MNKPVLIFVKRFRYQEITDSGGLDEFDWLGQDLNLCDLFRALKSCAQKINIEIFKTDKRPIVEGGTTVFNPSRAVFSEEEEGY